VRSTPRALLRLLYLELRRNPWPWAVPLVAALFVFDPYRSAMGYPPLWDLRASVIPNKLLPDFVAFAAGFSAWAGSRDGRRKTADMVTATAWAGWGRRCVTLAATVCWVLAALGVLVAVLYVATARQATWGGAPWWPVAVTAAALVALCAAGFAAGEFFPGRFTAPLAAVGAFFVSLVGFQQAVGETGGYALLSPSASVPNLDIGVFYHYLPDLAIAQVMFLAGIAAVAVGALGRSPAADGSPRLRVAAAAVAVAGLAAAGTAVGLAGTARATPHGVVVPALHAAAADQPIAYTPVCGRAVVPVCVHPAFRSVLPALTAALGPVLRVTAGLPGAPVQVRQVPSRRVIESFAALTGAPPVFALPLDELPGSFGTTTASFRRDLQALYVTAFVTGHGAPDPAGSPVQQAVELALLRAAGNVSFEQGRPHDPLAAKAQATIVAAADRFAALPAGTRRGWLGTHLPLLRAGRVTMAQLP
jgi:hypothetical protein